MSSKDTISAKTYNIESFFSDRIICTPPEQRYYAWKHKHAKKLWEDLSDHFLGSPNISGTTDYFLGTVLLHSYDGKSIVYDGQQRLATITMILCIARDLIDKYKMHNKNPTQFEELKKKLDNIIGNDKKWHIYLNKVDQEIFEKIQDKPPNIPLLRSLKLRSHRRLIRNYTKLGKMIKGSIYSNFDKKQLTSMGEIESGVSQSIIKKKICKNATVLADFLDSLDTVKIVRMEITDIHILNQVFETMNERGSKLTPSDLIKNHLFNYYTQNTEILNVKWEALFRTITKYVEPTTFLFDSYRSRYFEEEDRGVTSNNLYDFVKEKIYDQLSAEKYIKQLDEDKEFLAELYNRESEMFSHIPRSVQLLKAINIRAPLLAAHHKCNKSEYNKLAHLLVKFFFKQKTILNERDTVIADVTFKVIQKIKKK